MINMTGKTKLKKKLMLTGLIAGFMTVAVTLVSCSNLIENLKEKKAGYRTVVGAIPGSKVFIEGRTVEIYVAWACDHEVTQDEYQAVMETNPSAFKSKPVDGEIQENRPVETVSWYECLVYCNKRSMNEGLIPCYTVKGSTNPSDWGRVPSSWPSSIMPSFNSDWDKVTCNFEANGYRLPTEAEWEYLARSGNSVSSGQTTYSGSNIIDDVAWYEGNTNKTHEIKKKDPNSFGLYDMSGNVLEWCWDWQGSITTATPSVGVSSGTRRVLRGGSFLEGASTCSVSWRGSYYPSFCDSWGGRYSVGFRVVRSAN